jgi:hypothetical protein
MGRRTAGGITAKGQNRIQFDFKSEGVRYRPSLQRPPTETNLRRAHQHLDGIKQRIAAGTFSFAEEFPYFRDLKKVPGGGWARTCAQVFDDFLAHWPDSTPQHRNDVARLCGVDRRRD